ncbi:MarR family winged helix-turn-helix transcriptional regulator [Clostridium pasteurianum]|uniref:Transcriptional regulator n=1 Tax=Clostridium pasteurianum BC1 TaxID=86416 RepID=R4K6N3_CLOPA|nr:transcriptional regulator [Clostridium pasteurianum BC1]
MNDKITSLTKLNGKIYRSTQCYIDKRLEKFKLSTGIYPYLLILNETEGISQNEISRELSVDKAMSARTIKKLIELGYIEKRENKEDIRAYRLFLTDKGREVIPEIIKVIHSWIAILVEGCSEEEMEIGIEFLDKVLLNARKHKEKCKERIDGI